MEPELGERIRQERRKKRITLKQLSQLSGLSVSFLSQIERGVTSIAVTSLKKISDALGVSTSVLFQFDTPQSGYYSSLEAQKGQRLIDHFTTHTRLSGNFEGRKLEAIVYHLDPGTRDMAQFSHEGEEFNYILRGKVDFKVGNEVFQLSAGESVHYPSTMPHTILNIDSEQGVDILSVLTTHIYP